MPELTYPFLSRCGSMSRSKVLRTLKDVNRVVRVFFGRYPFQVLYAIIGRLAVLMIDVWALGVYRQEGNRYKSMDLYCSCDSVLMKSYERVMIAAGFRVRVVANTQQFARSNSTDASAIRNAVSGFVPNDRSPYLARQIWLTFQRFAHALRAVAVSLNRPDGVVVRPALFAFAGLAKPIIARWRGGVSREVVCWLTALASGTISVAYTVSSHCGTLLRRVADWSGSFTVQPVCEPFVF